ncbi:MAG: molybdopterin-dependent oxidoreductase [Lentimicrobium sp.]|jgi:predicted molibdopterin-dependent oxidoreductase YjgC|nr:molybdopterin-dependent oxidoreductase [Lentimicrobium sp.]MDD2527557.1 molybdopterin-dependent oxidoreductase [Lentimicrobiaceae bacterium]MDD4597130.1 molybdopterin-dependent oxidoreductase [Lentimicrobiaceae bacterium]MDY0025132.1 molybdopterin-dependent oxidoreductase [Lentimicrobium sp.]
MQVNDNVTPVNVRTICPVCSVGCSLEVVVQNGQIANIQGIGGLINPEGEYCALPLAAVKELKKLPRIIQPLLRDNGGFKPIAWQDAFALITDEIKTCDPSDMAFFAGARIGNEEQYLIQKLARAGARTNNINTFHYLGRELAYAGLSKANLPFPEMELTTHVYLIGADVTITHPVLADFIFKQQLDHGCRVTAISAEGDISGSFQQKTIRVTSIYNFIKAVNHYILTEHLEDHLFLEPLIGNFEEYRKHLLSNSFESLVQLAGVGAEVVSAFATSYLGDKSAVLLFAENNSGASTCSELFNLACISGKHGKTGSGLMLLKEKNNAHGLYDMGVMPSFSPGTDNWHDPLVRQRFQQAWQSGELPDGEGISLEKLERGYYKKLFIFGEDPVGCAFEPERFSEPIGNADFTVVQDYFLTPTAALAHLILPASWPWENGGTYTNTQKVLQNSDKIQSLTPGMAPEMASWQQLNQLLNRLNAGNFEVLDEVLFEAAGLFPLFCSSSRLHLRLTAEENFTPIFKAGCDAVSALSVKV